MLRVIVSHVCRHSIDNQSTYTLNSLVTPADTAADPARLRPEVHAFKESITASSWAAAATGCRQRKCH